MAKDATELLELTEREKAIARGEDPDAMPLEPEESPAEDAEPEDRTDVTEDEESGREAADSDWRTPELAAQHGLEMEDLKQFDSEGALATFAAILSRERQRLAGEKPAVKPAEAPVESTAEDGEVPDLDIEVFQQEGYSAETLDLVRYAKATKQQLDKALGEITKLRNSSEMEARKQRTEAFHAAADTLPEELFGRSVMSGKRVVLSGEPAVRRQRLMSTAAQLASVMEANGEAVPSESELVKRAAEIEFGEDLKRVEQRTTTSRLRQQSQRRRGVAGGARSRQAPVPTDAESLADHPDIVKFWNHCQEENGAR